MFKNLKLATKMGLGFGVLVVICGVLGIMGWSGLSGVSDSVELGNAGDECLTELNKCASTRKDFAIMGFARYDGQDVTAADKWQQAYDGMKENLQTLRDSELISGKDKEQANKILSYLDPYKGTFQDQVKARTMMDEGFIQDPDV